MLIKFNITLVLSIIPAGGLAAFGFTFYQISTEKLDFRIILNFGQVKLQMSLVKTFLYFYQTVIEKKRTPYPCM